MDKFELKRLFMLEVALGDAGPGQVMVNFVLTRSMSFDEIDELIRVLDYSRKDFEPELSALIRELDTEM